MSTKKTLCVTLTKIDYFSHAQRSSDIGHDLEFTFTVRGETYKVDAGDLEHGNTKTFGNNVLLYKIMEDSDFPYEIDIRATAREEDSVPFIDATDDTNRNPVNIKDFVVNKDDSEVRDSLEIQVHEDGNPKKHAAIFKCHFLATLKAIEEEETEEEEEEISEETTGGSSSSSSGGSTSGGTEIAPEESFLQYLDWTMSSEKEVLAFISDVHMGADECVDDFDSTDDGALVALINYVGNLKCKSKELILLGDFLELWETAPYFKDVKGYNDRVDASKIKINKIVKKHKVVFDALSAFSGSNKLSYVYGNHDDDLVESEVRGHFIKKSGIKASFGFEYSNDDFEVFSQHGHQFDKNNFSSNPLVDLPVGRWIVENFVVPMEQVKVNGKCTDLGRVDSFNQTSKFADYIRCLHKSGAISQAAYGEVKKIIDNLNSNTPLTGITGVASSVTDRLYDILKAAKTKTDLQQFEEANKIIEFLKLGVHLSKDNYEGLMTGTNRSCVLMGHTHEGYLQKISSKKVIGNTGTWLDKIVANDINPCRPSFGDTRHVVFLVKSKTSSEVTEGEHTHPAGTVKVDVYLHAMFPSGLRQLSHTFYFLEP